jgi:hypothetical protein
MQRLTVHLGYDLPGIRDELLDKAFPSILATDADIRLYFCDIDVTTDRSAFGMELSLWYRMGRRAPTGRAGLESALACSLERCSGNLAVEEIGAPWLLSPFLFPGGVCPPAYADCLAVGSCRIIHNQLTDGSLERLAQRIRTEVVALFSPAVLHPAGYIAALAIYRDWLASARPNAVPTAAMYAETDAAQPKEKKLNRKVALEPRYDEAVLTLRTDIAMLLGRHKDPDDAVNNCETESAIKGISEFKLPRQGPGRRNCNVILTACLARLGHVQTVRLLGHAYRYLGSLELAVLDRMLVTLRAENCESS